MQTPETEVCLKDQQAREADLSMWPDCSSHDNCETDQYRLLNSIKLINFTGYSCPLFWSRRP